MNILMMVTWYTPKGSTALEAGVFHYEQSMDLKKYCNMALYYPFDKDISEIQTREDEWGLTTYRSKYSVGRMIYNRRNMDRTMKRIVQEFKPDIIHAHCGAGAGYYVVKLAKKYNIPVVITEHNPIEISKVDKKGLNYWKTKKAYEYSKANVCVSTDSMNKLSKIYPQCSFEVIYT